MLDRERLDRHARRVFEKSKRTEFTTVARAAKALRWPQQKVVDVAEANDFTINVAVACNGAVGKLPMPEWEIEPMETDNE